jgi:hypothetical protein
MISLAFRLGNYDEFISQAVLLVNVKLFASSTFLRPLGGPLAFEDRIGVNDPIVPNGWPSNQLVSKVRY